MIFAACTYVLTSISMFTSQLAFLVLSRQPSMQISSTTTLLGVTMLQLRMIFFSRLSLHMDNMKNYFSLCSFSWKNNAKLQLPA